MSETVLMSSDEQAQLLLDHTCNSRHLFNARGIRQARWSSFATGRNRLHVFILCVVLFVLHEILLFMQNSKFFQLLTFITKGMFMSQQ